MTTPKVVITFRTRINPGFDIELLAVGARMFDLASAMPGFLAYKEYAAADGEFVTLVEFDTAEHLAAWRNHPEHLDAQQEGRDRFFSWYQIQVCQVEREYSYQCPSAP